MLFDQSLHRFSQLFGRYGYGSIPDFYDEEAEEAGEDVDFVSILDELSEHLADGETAIIQETGSEKLRCLTGFAIAIHSTGETASVNLESIHEIAGKKFGGNISHCSW